MRLHRRSSRPGCAAGKSGRWSFLGLTRRRVTHLRPNATPTHITPLSQLPHSPGLPPPSPPSPPPSPTLLPSGRDLPRHHRQTTVLQIVRVAGSAHQQRPLHQERQLHHQHLRHFRVRGLRAQHVRTGGTSCRRVFPNRPVLSFFEPQLCINYANEKLHSLFVDAVLKTEQVVPWHQPLSKWFIFRLWARAVT
jgi:hypothetical protein